MPTQAVALAALLWGAAARAEDGEASPPNVLPVAGGEPLVAPATPAAVQDDVVAELEARLAALEAAAATPPPPPPPVGWQERLDLRISGYVQAQYEHHQLSVDEISADGGALNQDRFLVRRGRLRIDRYWRYASADLELDANTVRGPFVSVRRAEASLFLPHPTAPIPYIGITAGLGEIPFGHELPQGQRDRLFTERTTGSQAFFPGEPDVGVHAWGGAGPIRYDLAVQNGVPLDDRPGADTGVFQHQKTLVGRLGFVGDGDGRELSGGVSFLDGTGFHEGNPETKSQLLWRDLNQDGNPTLNELVAVPGQAATPSITFSRWAVNADLHAGIETRLGWTRVTAEITMATNLDRGFWVADPISTGYDLRETAWYASVVQDVRDVAFVGFRVDQYDGNADFFETRRGLFLPGKAATSTVSPIVGARLEGIGRAVFQYDHVQDTLGRDDRGEPIDLPNDVWTARVQVEF